MNKYIYIYIHIRRKESPGRRTLRGHRMRRCSSHCWVQICMCVVPTAQCMPQAAILKSQPHRHFTLPIQQCADF